MSQGAAMNLRARLDPRAAAVTAALLLLSATAQAQTQTPGTDPERSDREARPPRSTAPEATLPTVNVSASADASAQGLSAAYPGGQVARGARLGILGTRDGILSPVSTTSYTNEFIQDRQARGVGDVLQNDAGVRMARGFGNLQETFFIRGFILNSDDIAYNGLYGLLPRQYIATELFERVEVLRGPSAFLSGAAPSGGGIGGSINLVPKRALNDPLSRITVGTGSGPHAHVAMDLSRRFGPDDSTGLRINGVFRNGQTSVDHERTRLGLFSVAGDWRSSRARLSADVGYQYHGLKSPRPNVSLASALTSAPRAPEGSHNFAQPWTYSNERDLFGTVRGEYDVTDTITAWGAWGVRRSAERNSLANPEVYDAATGAARTYRFDNARRDSVQTAEVGVRGKVQTGPVGHEWVASASHYRLDKKNAYAITAFNALPTNIHAPVDHPQPSPFTVTGNDLDAPRLQGKTRLSSVAVGDTLSALQERLLVTLGLRWQNLSQRDYAYDTGEQTSHYDKSRISPMVGAVYRLTPRFSVYGNYIEGLSQGGTAPAQTVNVGETMAPYVSRQKEIGLKADLGRIGGTVSLFSTTRPRGIVNAARVYSTSGQDRHRGVEANVFGQPLRGTRVLGGITYLNATQRSTGDAGNDGARVIGVPRWQGNLGLDQDIPGINGLAADGRIVYTGSSQANDANTLRVGGWTRIDLGARYIVDIQGRPVTLRARIDNLLDRRMWSSVGGYPGYGYLVAGAGRTFMLSASLDL